MMYSTYRSITIGGYVVFGLLVFGVLLPVSPGLAVAFLLLLGLIGAVGVPLHLALTRDRLDDHDGRIPMPGAWGM
jgi:hypothetical protein